jgi:hypothetical protein
MAARMVRVALKSAARTSPSEPLERAFVLEVIRIENFVRYADDYLRMRLLEADLSAGTFRMIPVMRGRLNGVPSAFGAIVAELLQAGVTQTDVAEALAVYAHTDPETARGWLYRRLLRG